MIAAYTKRSMLLPPPGLIAFQATSQYTLRYEQTANCNKVQPIGTKAEEVYVLKAKITWY